MKSCGVVVEYNPFHHGHAYHIQKAKEVSQADTMIAVMSGNFLQRGEPAIIDKFHRTKAALASGVDLVLELPYAFAVQNSDYFAKGAIHTLHAIGAASICFGSESGQAEHFITSYQAYTKQRDKYDRLLKHSLNNGNSFPQASMHAFQAIGLTNETVDLSQPNNILGFSYVKAIFDDNLPVNIHTIKRLNNDFHEPEITNSIASATSIRHEIIEHDSITSKARTTIPEETYKQLQKYKQKTGLWHDWEKYFQFLNYRVQTMSTQELREIQGVSEGLEYRLKSTAKHAQSMNEWLTSVKTKRYTWTRLQRLFTHILTNTKKSEINSFQNDREVPFVRILGMTEQGQKYLNHIKKKLEVPTLFNFSRDMDPLLQLEERATAAYLSILSPQIRKDLIIQERSGPIRMVK